MTPEELPLYLQKVNRIRTVESIVKERVDYTTLPHYYRDSGLLYRRFHSPEGAMHLPIKTSENERHKHKLLFQARAVGEYIKEHNFKTVVELGCGNGFNSTFLAKEFPDVQFLAMDITEYNLEVGRKMSEGLTNLTFKQFDFSNDPHTYKADLVFGVETLCYAPNLTTLFQSIFNCLNPNGKLVIFDAYVNHSSRRKVLNANEEKAYSMLNWGFVLKRFQEVDEVYHAVRQNNLDLEFEYDFSQHILPNFKVFQAAAKKLLRIPLLTRILLALKIIPYALFKQSLSGLFGTYLVEFGFLGYYQFVLKRKD